MAEKRKKKIRLAPIIILACVIALAAGGIIVFRTCFKITEVTIEGTDIYTYEELYSYCFQDRNDDNMLLFKWTNSQADDPVIPFISKIVYETKGNHTIAIQVYEKNIAGYTEYKGTNMYFDKDGLVVESSKEIFEGVPKVTGLNFTSVVLYNQLEVDNPEAFSVIQNLWQYLGKYDITVDCINVDGDNTYSVYMGDVIVSLGAYDNKMGDKINELSCMIVQLSGMKGTLYLDDFDGTGENIIFKETE